MKPATRSSDGGYALSGPKYYAAFRDVALEMIQKYGVNQFKFDGTGNVDRSFPAASFDSDFCGMIHLIERTARSQARSVHQSHHRHMAFALLDDARRLHLARRGRRLNSPASGPTASAGSPIAMPIPTAGRAEWARSIRSIHSCSTASSTRSIIKRSRQGSGQRLPQRDSLLLRHRHAVAGDVHHALAADCSRTGTTWPKRQSGRAQMPMC